MNAVVYGSELCPALFCRRIVHAGRGRELYSIDPPRYNTVSGDERSINNAHT